MVRAAKRSFAVVAMPCQLGVGDESVGSDYAMLNMRDCVSDDESACQKQVQVFG